VQTGVARTGTWFAFQHTSVMPDVMTLAKGLGSGMPIGACLARGVAAETFTPGKHGSTFGGGPLACTAALTTLAVMEADGLLENAARLGAFIRSDLAARLHDQAGLVEIRGQGLMIGIQLDRPCGELVKMALDEKLLINVTNDNVVRLLPPLVLTQVDAELLTEKLARLIRTFLG
jgi:acetylornithine/N-succinyldiaminopimelate aminotransferase